MSRLWMTLVLAFLVLGLSAASAFSLDPADGDLAEADQDPEFDDEAAFAEVDDLADEIGEDVDDEADEPDGGKNFRIVGVWQYTAKDSGWFAGKLYRKVNGKRVLVRRVKGLFEKSLHGDRELAGVILNRAGKYVGTIRGKYGKKGFQATWRTGKERKPGRVSAKFIAPFGRAGFVGKVTVPKVDTDDDDEEEL